MKPYDINNNIGSNSAGNRESFYSEQIQEKVELINHIQNFNDPEKFTQDLEKTGGYVCVERTDED